MLFYLDTMLWSVRIACVLYVLAIGAKLRGRLPAFRLLWRLGLGLYLVHVATAFAFHHGWSHDAAYRETARQTALLFGADWGGGIYFNYLFTIVWGLDAVWRWSERKGWASTAIHAFMAFMFLNATVVFGTGWIRWLGVTATFALTALWWKERPRALVS